MNKLFISAIIVAYKSEKYINTCIDTLRKSAQYAKIPIEIIVVVNDEDPQKYQLENCNIINNYKNLGFAKAVNIGAKKAQGNWFLLINPDTEAHLDTISKLSFYFNEKDIGVIAPKILNADTTLQYSVIDIPSLWSIFIETSYLYKILPNLIKSPQTSNFYYRNTIIAPSAKAAFFLTPKELFLKIGRFDERFFMYLEDIDYCKRVTNYGYKIVYEPNTYVTHLRYRSSDGFRIASYYFESLQEFWGKHYNGSYWSFVSLLLLFGLSLRFIFWTIRYQFSSDKKQHEARLKIKYSLDGIKYLFSRK